MTPTPDGSRDPRDDEGGRGGEGEPRVVIRDRRRIDPLSGEVRPENDRDQTGRGQQVPAGAPAPAGGPAAGPPFAASTGAGAPAAGSPSASPDDPGELFALAELQHQVLERTADLQRLKAEFDNYRRRVERDRATAGEQATARVLLGLLPALDDIDRARQHGDLSGPFRAVADSLSATMLALGLESYGLVGDPFDPLVHEAVMHRYSEAVGGPTCVEVFRAGYSYAGRVLRPAQVVVAEPEPSAGAGGAPRGDGGHDAADLAREPASSE